MEARYLNVDLLIESNCNLSPLISYLDNKIFVLWSELKDHYSSIGIETNIVDSTGPEDDIREFLRLIDGLPSDLKMMFLDSTKRVFDVGYECGSMENPINSLINPEIINKLAELNCAINFRLYPQAGEPAQDVTR